MKKLPKKVSIMGIPYKVKYCVKLKDVDCDREELYSGCINYEKAEIRVFAGSRNRKSMEKTIWHEVLHAIVNEQKLYSILGNKEERVVDGIAAALMTVKFD